ncbi:MAG: sensor histidine kinase [Bacteroidota bacterium]
MDNFLPNLLEKANRWQWWFWLAIFLQAPVASLLGSDQGLFEAVIFRSFGMVGKMLAAYFVAYYLIPQVLFKRRYFSFIALLLSGFYVIAIIARILNVHVAEAIVYPEYPKESLVEIIIDVEYTFFAYIDRFLTATFWFTLIKVGIDQYRAQIQLTKVNEEKAVAELNLLKAQIHPHFLFNTLNNLYTLCLEKSDQAADVVVKLSDMLDYVLYKGNQPTVTIKQEVELIENYLGLESIRYGNGLKLEFRKEISDMNARIAPLLLLVPVENAFKHGASSAISEPEIQIELTHQVGVLDFEVRNSKPQSLPIDIVEKKQGIGLSNLRSQLELLYPEQHTLNILDSSDYYQLTLQINL